jgi:hypothetical protein
MPSSELSASTEGCRALWSAASTGTPNGGLRAVGDIDDASLGFRNKGEADIAWAQSSILKWRLVNRAKLLLVKYLTSRARSSQLALQKPANSVCRRDFQRLFHRRDPFPPSVSSLVRP